MEVLSFKLPIAINTSAYASGDNVGGLTLINRFGAASQSAGLLDSIFITDASGQKPDLDFLFFRENPSQSTFTNNATQTIHANDLGKIMAFARLTAVAYVDVGSSALGILNNLNVLFRGISGQPNAYLAIIARSTPTFATVNDLAVEIFVRK